MVLLTIKYIDTALPLMWNFEVSLSWHTQYFDGGSDICSWKWAKHTQTFYTFGSAPDEQVFYIFHSHTLKVHRSWERMLFLRHQCLPWATPRSVKTWPTWAEPPLFSWQEAQQGNSCAAPAYLTAGYWGQALADPYWKHEGNNSELCTVELLQRWEILLIKSVVYYDSKLSLLD